MSDICWNPFRRCKAVLPPNTPGAGPYHGRCELERDHDEDHLVERGFDNIRFRVQVVPVEEYRHE